jgi:hypothetical protein
MASYIFSDVRQIPLLGEESTCRIAQRLGRTNAVYLKMKEIKKENAVTSVN